MVLREEDGAQPLAGFREGVVAPVRDGAARALRGETRLNVPGLRYAWGRRYPFYTELCGE